MSTKKGIQSRDIKVKVRTIWQGQVGIRDKYITEARNSGKDLVITNSLEIMTIPNSEINTSIVALSEHYFKDYFSKDLHRLVYFKWKPDKSPQQKLFK